VTSGTLAAPVGGRRIQLILALAGLTALGPLSLDFYLPALPRIAEQLHGTASGAQFTLTACLAGLAAGQLIMGPLSDRFGRRGPLIVGMAGYIVASLLCALAPTVPVLVALRFLQGLAGAGGIVIARAVVRDFYEGNAAVRFFSLLMLVMGLAPILAPVIGGQLVGLVGWRGLFGVLAGAGAVILVAVLAWVPESWPPERRESGGVGQSLRSIGRLTRDRSLMGYAIASGLAFAAMFAYIAGSPFVIENVYGASVQAFSLVFAVNALGQMLVAQLNGRLVGRFGPWRLLLAGHVLIAVGGIGALGVVAAGVPGLPALLVPLFLVVASLGLVMPNAAALSLGGHPEAAGAASALLGVFQLAIGAAVAPLVGVGGAYTALPMTIVMAVVGVAALLVLVAMVGRNRSAADWAR
jgi:DHA1 family bicyclomycin/chloramphenicol resistance-like MFS transporter